MGDTWSIVLGHGVITQGEVGSLFGRDSLYLVMSQGDLSDQTEPSSDAQVSPLQQESAPSTSAPSHDAR